LDLSPFPPPAANWSGPKLENGSNRPYPGRRDGRDPPFSVLWGRNLQGGLVRAPLAGPNLEGVEKYHLEQSRIDAQ
jgi:hypothetical protein